VTGAPLVRDVILRDGSTLRLRSPVPADFVDIKGLYDGLSPENRYRRFHGFGRTDLAARDYAEADGEDRVVLIGRHGGRVVAAAAYDRLREPGAAEVAFTVADGFQGRGAATRLLEQLAGIAAERGIRRFDAEVLSENRPMLGVFKRAGFDLRRKSQSGEVEVALDIRPTTEVQELIAGRDHAAAVASLQPILAPGSVAVVGASGTPTSVGYAVVANLLDEGFTGAFVPVDRSGGEVRSVRVVRGLGELDAVPELVIVAVPAAEVLGVAAEAAEGGAKALLVLSEGLAEAGEAGRAREEELLDVVRSAGLRLVGPGSLGVINTDPAVRLNATVAAARVSPGGLAISSQSGAIGLGLLGHAAARRLGVSSFASLGVRADVSTNDLLEYWEEDDRTAAVMLYVESFGNPVRFSRIARRVACRKPLLAVKGRRAPGTDQPRSHTAAVAGGEAVLDALLRQAGVLRFRSGDDLFNAAQFFETQPLPRGRRLGIVTNSSGVADLAADSGAMGGLVVAEAGTVNVGHYGGAGEYAGAVRRLLAEDGIDAVIASYVGLSGGDPDAVLTAIGDAATEQPKPVVASVLTATGGLPEGGRAGVPNYLFPGSCASVLARAVERREWLSRPLGTTPRYPDLDPEAAQALVEARLTGEPEGPGAAAGVWLTTPEAEGLLASHGIPCVPSHPCPDAASAVEAAEAIGGAIALKADLPSPEHAGDIDATLLGLEGGTAVRAGWQELERRVLTAGRRWAGAVVQPLVGPGADVLVGTITDPEVGPVMAIGLGGRRAGLAGDVAFRLLPQTDVDADELLDASRSVSALLGGFRGSPPLDRDALRVLVLRTALLLQAVPEIVEADLNPVHAMADGALVLDMRLRVERRPPVPSVRTW